MVTVRGAKWLVESARCRAAPDRVLRGRRDCSAAASRTPGPRRAEGRAWQWRWRHTPSRWAVTAAAGVERMQRRREPAAIEVENGEQKACHDAGFAAALAPGVVRHARRFGICLLKDTHNLRLKFREIRWSAPCGGDGGSDRSPAAAGPHGGAEPLACGA